MLSKSQIKLITSLKQKKFRTQHQLFVAEGIKTITELLNSRFQLHALYTTTSAFEALDVSETIITPNELKKVSFFTTPSTALALFKIPEPEAVDFNRLVVALDDVRDPGNLGTIIRLCDWFGVKDLVCSKQTVDCYNPKVVQATMGSITRVNITYVDLPDFLRQDQNVHYGAFMDGDNVYTSELPDEGVLILGNEANGITAAVEAQVTQRIGIPRFGNLQKTESLNVANAAAVLLSEFKRRTIEK